MPRPRSKFPHADLNPTEDTGEQGEDDRDAEVPSVLSHFGPLETAHMVDGEGEAGKALGEEEVSDAETLVPEDQGEETIHCPGGSKDLRDVVVEGAGGESAPAPAGGKSAGGGDDGAGGKSAGKDGGKKGAGKGETDEGPEPEAVTKTRVLEIPRAPALDEAPAPEGCTLKVYPVKDRPGRFLWKAKLPATLEGGFEGNRTGTKTAGFPEPYDRDTAYFVCESYIRRAVTAGLVPAFPAA